MPGHTEQTLWQALAKGGARELCRMTRIETGDTALGVSDIEYVSSFRNGWAETKVLMTAQPTSTFLLNTPFTLEQWRWLMDHHRPQLQPGFKATHGLHSWLLVGKPKRKLLSGWEAFILIPAPLGGRFFHTRQKPTIGEVYAWPGVEVIPTAPAVVQFLATGVRDDG